MNAVAKITVLKTKAKLHSDTVRKAKEMHLSYAGVAKFVNKVDYIQVIRSENGMGLRKGINGIIHDMMPGRETVIEWS